MPEVADGTPLDLRVTVDSGISVASSAPVPLVIANPPPLCADLPEFSPEHDDARGRYLFCLDAPTCPGLAQAWLALSLSLRLDAVLLELECVETTVTEGCCYTGELIPIITLQ